MPSVVLSCVMRESGELPPGNAWHPNVKAAMNITVTRQVLLFINTFIGVSLKIGNFILKKITHFFDHVFFDLSDTFP